MRLLYSRIYRALPRFYSMPSTSTVKELARKEEEGQVHLQGWVKRMERRGEFTFARVSDGLSNDEVQLVIPKDVCETVRKGDAIRASGSWKSSKGHMQTMELYVEQCKIHAKDEDASYKNWNTDKLREHAHLRVRSESFAALLRLRSRLFLETHKFFSDLDYIHIDTPSLTQNDCEGAGELFIVQDSKSKDRDEFFGKPVFLTISSQLHLEAMTSLLFVRGIPKVYTVNKAYRADVQVSSSHLSEFRMLEVETGFCENIDETCDLVESYVLHCARLLLGDKAMQQDFALLGIFSTKDHLEIVRKIAESEKFPRVPYSEAVQILKSDKKWEHSRQTMNKKNELYLAKKFGGPVFVTHYPSNQKPFYVMRDPSDSSLALSFDLLAPIVGELAGGTVREQSIEEITKRGGGDIDW
ncbi:hypothetical protein WR25_26106 [Diploscapter pachys]|uniref:Aminoacyl-transfer RNA synthetases class-II family profile domain-containing protein n=1 Tax=Diploscapter pachys TaxID=2018661 RepID=A0A2A2J5T4_9BILA|nr:hypothetical protein WR25_26106 [Diploscapter pachys]